MYGGYIKLWRSTEFHWIWINDRHLKWWCQLLFMAAWEPMTVTIGNESIDIDRGQIATTIRTLMKRWGAHSQAALAFLNVLEKEHMITRKSNKRMTIITIENYAKYQSDAPEILPFSKRKSKHKSKQIKEIGRKYNEENSSSSSLSREQKIEFLKGLETNVEFWENTCMGIYAEVAEILIAGLKTRYKKFIGEHSKGDRLDDTADKIEKHLFNWLRRSVEIEAERKTRAHEKSSINNYQNQSNQSDTNGRITKDKYDPRRSSPVSDATADDGDGAF